MLALLLVLITESFFHPFNSAGIALPVLLAHADGELQKQPQAEGPETIDRFEGDVERITTGAARLRVSFACLFIIELFWYRFVEEGARLV